MGLLKITFVTVTVICSIRQIAESIAAILQRKAAIKAATREEIR